MSEIQTLRTYIINYSKTREVYTGYRKAGYSKRYLAEHESDILIHKANAAYLLGLEDQKQRTHEHQREEK